MSSEINNYYRASSTFNLRMNSLAFSASRNNIWKSSREDFFERSSCEGVPVETRAKIFSNELIRLVESKQVCNSKLNQIISKYLPNTKVEIISMNNYDEFGMNTKKNVAAATRPIYDKDAKLKAIKIFVPELEYGDKLSENKYIENLTHELTHAMQFADIKEPSKNLKDTEEGHFYNFYQQNVANMLVDTIVQKTLVTLAKRDAIEMYSLSDYDRFIEQQCEEITDDEMREIHTPSSGCSFEKNIRIGFNVYLDGLMKRMKVDNDEIAQAIIKEAGGMEAFRAEIMQMVSNTLSFEAEAYKAGSIARKTARGFSGRDYNDSIWQVIGLMAEALKN